MTMTPEALGWFAFGLSMFCITVVALAIAVWGIQYERNN